jgi:hypothetical protein
MGRIGRSFQLMKQSYRVLMQDKELLILPVLSGLCILLVSASFVVPLGLFGEGGIEEKGEGLMLGVVFLFYVVTYTISFFFQAAIIAGANERMAGGDPTLGSALGAAGRRFGALLLWGVIAATVGMIIRAIEERSEVVGRIVMGLIGVAWSLATFFMVPVLVMERQPIGGSFKRSWTLFKETWGETVIGTFGFGILTFLGILLIAGVCYLLWSAGLVVPAVVVGALLLALLLVFTSALQGVYVAALYRFATTGDTPGGFDAEVIRGAFAPKGR